MNILFVTSEAYPLIKTGGLADVSGSLPLALQELGHDVSLMLPAYTTVMDRVENYEVVANTRHYEHDIRVLESQLADSEVRLLLVDCPVAFDRPGNPYVDDAGQPWADNAYRFALFNQVAVDVALNRLGMDWPVDLVHCNDWQAGLVPPLLSLFANHPATVFTIHNLAYMGLYDKQIFFELGLPLEIWHLAGVEFHDLFSFIKGGLSYADCVNTVSPQYAMEIQTPAFGYGLEGLLQHRADRMSGIMNGIDQLTWNPASDENLVQNFDQDSLEKKASNKLDLQKRYDLKKDGSIPLIGFIGRLVEQKGLDMIIDAMPELTGLPLQMLFLGSGEKHYEQALLDLAEQYPATVVVVIGYDEELSHQIEAGCDMFLMPSLFEPCGLNQLYSLAYGTIPLVTPVGGLVDSVVDHSARTMKDKTATGFMLETLDGPGLVQAIERALAVYAKPKQWQQMQLNGMKQDFSWQSSAEQYVELYEKAIAFNAG